MVSPSLPTLYMKSYGASFDLGVRGSDHDVVDYMDIDFGWTVYEEFEDDGSGDALDPLEFELYYDWRGAEDRVWGRYLKTTYDEERTPRVDTGKTPDNYYAAESSSCVLFFFRNRRPGTPART